MSELTRRDFLTTVPFLLPLAGAAYVEGVTSKFGGTFKVLFQGDSITDGNRGRDSDPNHILGHGYAFAIAAELGFKHPERNLEFVNRGVSGDKLSDMKSRWQTDAVDLQPDLVSILIGINDVLNYLGNHTSFDEAAFEHSLLELIDLTKQKLPQVAIVLGEPFILPVGMVLKDKDGWYEMVGAVQKVTAQAARDINAVFVPYQSAFNSACKRAPAEYWIWDGIHPTYAGHGLMKEIWLDAVSERIKLLKSSAK